MLAFSTFFLQTSQTSYTTKIYDEGHYMEIDSSNPASTVASGGDQVKN